jgi:hypothetical protein
VDPVTVVETTEQRCGDPRHLAIIARCIEGERQLLGLDAAKGAYQQGSGEPTLGQPLAQLPKRPVPDRVEEEIARVLALPKPGEKEDPVLTTCEPTAHRFFPSDSASFRFRRFRPKAHRRVLCWPSPLLAILP